MGGELVEEGIGRRVVGLARVAEHAGDAGEEHEHVEVARRSRPVQVPGAEHLGPQHRLEALPRLVADGGVRQHADAVDDARERRQFRVHPRQHGVERGGVRHVRELHLHSGPLGAELFDRLGDLGLGRAAAVEHDGAGAALGEPPGDRDTDAAESAGHQVAPVLAQPASGERRVGEDDLADVARALHALHRAPRLGHGPAGVDERSQFAGLEPRHHPAQYFPGLCGLLLLENVDHEDGVGDVWPERRHLVLAQDVHSAHFHEAAALGQAREARIDEALAGQAVQHHVDPGAAGGFEDVGAERRRAAVEDVGHAERAQIVPLARACRRKHLRAGRPGQLDRREPDAAGAGVNQHAVAGVQPRQLERERGRDECRGNRRELGDRKSRRCGHDHLFQGHRLRAEILERHADDAIAYGNAGDALADLQHPAAELAAHEVVDEADGDEHVAEVEPEGLDRRANLAGLKQLRRLVDHLNGVEGATGIGLQHPAGLLRQRQPVRDRRSAHQPGALAAAEAVGDVGLGVGIEKLVHEFGRARRIGGVEIEHPRLELGRLPRRHLAQAPERGAGQLAAALALQHLGAARHEPEPLRRGEIALCQRLGQRQRARRRVARICRHLLRAGLCAVAVEPGEMHDAGERHIGGQVLQQRFPRVAPRPLHERLAHAGPIRNRWPASGCIGTGEDDRLVVRREFRSQLCREAAPVGGQHPEARGLGHLRRPLRHDHAPVRVGVGIGLVEAQDGDVVEPGIAEGLAPHGGGGEGMVRAVVVREAPPAVQLPESEVEPALAAEVLQRHKLARRREQRKTVRQRLVQVARRVQHVRRDHQVVAVQIEALLHRVLLDIQHPVVDGRLGTAEARLRFREEAGGDVRVDVVVTPVRKLGQDRGRRRPGAGAHLDDPEPAPGRHPGQERRHRVGQQPVGRAGHRRLEIEVGRSRLAAAEEQCERIRLAAQHVGERIGAAPEEPDLVRAVVVLRRHPARECLRVVRHGVRQRVFGADRHDEPAVRLVQHAGPDLHFEQPAEKAPVLVPDLEPLAQVF